MSEAADRDIQDDAEARRWAEETRRAAAENRLPDGADFLERKLAEERSKLTPQVTWTIVTQESFERWAAQTDDDLDAELRIAVLTWVVALQEAGPPADGVHDPFRDTLHCEVGNTGVWIEYLVLPYLTEPAIVIREYRGTAF